MIEFVRHSVGALLPRREVTLDEQLLRRLIHRHLVGPLIITLELKKTITH